MCSLCLFVCYVCAFDVLLCCSIAKIGVCSRRTTRTYLYLYDLPITLWHPELFWMFWLVILPRVAQGAQMRMTGMFFDTVLSVNCMQDVSLFNKWGLVNWCSWSDCEGRRIQMFFFYQRKLFWKFWQSTFTVGEPRRSLFFTAILRCKKMEGLSS